MGTERQFKTYLAKNATGVTLRPEKVKAAYKHIAKHGLQRGSFLNALARFFKVVQDVSITDEFELQSAKKVRKLELDELVELVGEPQEETTLNLERCFCRAIRDGAEGWATIRST